MQTRKIIFKEITKTILLVIIVFSICSGLLYIYTLIPDFPSPIIKFSITSMIILSIIIALVFYSVRKHIPTFDINSIELAIIVFALIGFSGLFQLQKKQLSYKYETSLSRYNFYVDDLEGNYSFLKDIIIRLEKVENYYGYDQDYYSMHLDIIKSYINGHYEDNVSIINYIESIKTNENSYVIQNISDNLENILHYKNELMKRDNDLKRDKIIDYQVFHIIFLWSTYILSFIKVLMGYNNRYKFLARQS